MVDLLKIRDLYVRVDGEEVLHGVNLTVPDGEVHALLGPNGSGKTSLIMTVMGFPDYEVTQGSIIFDGQDITELDITGRARLGIGIAQQRPPTMGGVKLRHILDYAIAMNHQQVDKVDKLAENAGMQPFLDRDVNAGLSGGEIKRSELLQLLATHPRFAMTDEPDSGVDLDSMELVGRMVTTLFSKDPTRPAKRNTGLIITHTGRILSFVQADKAHVMLGGCMACSGNPALILDTVRESGYADCVRCIQQGV